MVIFVYSTLAPITCYVLAFCFVVMNVGYRHQMIYIYPSTPDSGGRLWLSYVHVVVWCMLTAEVTLGGYLVLKKSSAAYTIMLPFLMVTVMFYVYLHQRHFRVAFNLPSEVCHQVDTIRSYCNDVNIDENIKNYRQPALKVKEIHPDFLPIPSEILRRQQNEIITKLPGLESCCSRLTSEHDDDHELNPRVNQIESDDNYVSHLSNCDSKVALLSSTLLSGHFANSEGEETDEEMISCQSLGIVEHSSTGNADSFQK
jgi:Calcium-dependent channel, 7TM region, putative phosphate